MRIWQYIIESLKTATNLPQLWLNFGASFCYLLLASFAFHFIALSGSGHYSFLANGFALAILLFTGPSTIWGTLTGVLLSGWILDQSYSTGTLKAIINCTSIFSTYWLITHSKSKQFDPNLNSLHDYWRLIIFGGAGCMVGSFLFTILAWLMVLTSDLPTYLLFLEWWMADLLGLLLICPIVLLWWPKLSMEQMLNELPTESLLAIGITVLLGQLVTWNWLPDHLAQHIFGFWMLPLITWAILRLHSKEVAIISTISLLSPFLSLSDDFALSNETLSDTELLKSWIAALFVATTSMTLAIANDAQRNASRAFQEEADFFKMIAERTDDLIAILDLEGRRVYNTLSYRRLFGNVDRLKGSNSFHEIHPDDREHIKQVFSDTILFGIGQWTEFRFVLANGSVRNMESRGELLCDEHGKSKWVLVISRDITDRKLIEENYRIANIAFESQDGMFITDINDVILRVNRAFTEITGYSPDEIVGKSSKFLRSNRHIENLDISITESLNHQGAWRGEIRCLRKNGENYLTQQSISIVQDDNGNTTHHLTILEDITLRKLDEEKIKQLAFHDPLTQLANRRKLLDRLRHSIAIGKREKLKMALLIIDIDRFKAINDIFGTNAGDELLQQVAGRLQKHLQDTDLVARFGSDEFIIFLENISKVEDISRLAEHLIEDLSKPFNLTRSNNVKIGVNIGISLFPKHGDSAETLLEQADVALYQAKEKGRGGYAYFSDNFIRSP